MWLGMYMEDIIKRFLPSTAEMVVLVKPFNTPAVKLVDLDGDGVLELVFVYYWHGENYIRLLKYNYNHWYVAATRKGKGYGVTILECAPITRESRNNLIVGWQVASIWSDLTVYQWTGTELTDLVVPYTSKEEMTALRKNICEYNPFSIKYGIDFSSIKYTCSETERDMKLEEAIEKEYNLKLNKENIRYYYNKVDLDDDGIPEVFVFLVGSYVCGTGGCSAVIFKQENGDYKVLSTFSLVRNPVVISNTKTNGYKDIIMYVAGGGIESFFARMKYDGTTYPLNPSIQPKVEPGIKVDGIAIVSDDIAKNPGIG